MNLKYKYELEKILDNESIDTVFQPIVSLENGSVIGYEALSRGPEDSPLHLPEDLFSTAEECDRIWELELLCRVKAIERAKMIDKDKLLFINVDPKIFKDERFRKGFTKEFLKKHNMSPNLIIFEITEKTAIEDYHSFKIALNNYINQGYKIAIDDMGTGYSGLRTLMETKPHYIKIDISFISGIDKDEFKQELVKNFVSLAHFTNMKIIAEGIENEKELLKLINLGVSAGQGYLLQRPYKKFLDISKDIKKKIIKYNNIRQNQLKSETSYIGNIVQKNPTFSLTASNKQVKKFFEFSSVTGVCIIKDNYPEGLIMQHNLDYILATQYGNSVFLKRPVSLIMDSSPLIVDYYNTISNVSKIAMSRDSKRIYDYVIVTKKNKYCGIVTIKNLLEYTVKFEKNNAKNLNPLTGLPGNKIINKTLNNILNCDSNFFLIYADLNNFKVYNDTYGFENGDKVLKFTAKLIQEQIKYNCPYNSFIGHIGGDDFVCIFQTKIEKCYEICREIIFQFDLNVIDFFNEKDKSNGYIESFDRKGNKDIFPLTSIALGCMYGKFNKFKEIDDIGICMSKIKKKAKENKNSAYVVFNINDSNFDFIDIENQ